MAPTIQEKNLFQRWLQRLVAKTNTLAANVERGNLEKLEKEFSTALSTMERLFEHANQFDIDLVEYQRLIQTIEDNFEQFRRGVEKRRAPFLTRFSDFLFRISPSVDNLLMAFGFPPLVYPILTLTKALGKLMKKALPAPKDQLKLPAQTGPSIGRSDNNIDSALLNHTKKKQKFNQANRTNGRLNRPISSLTGSQINNNRVVSPNGSMNTRRRKFKEFDTLLQSKPTLPLVTKKTGNFSLLDSDDGSVFPYVKPQMELLKKKRKKLKRKKNKRKKGK